MIRSYFSEINSAYSICYVEEDKPLGTGGSIRLIDEKFSEPIRILLSMLCYHRDSLPQGAPTSPAITNIIMYEFDETVGAFCNNKKIAYTRYCDDMTFSGDFDEKAIISVVKDELRKLGLFLKNRKTAVIPSTKRQTVTGIVVNEKIGLTKEYKNKIKCRHKITFQVVFLSKLRSSLSVNERL